MARRQLFPDCCAVQSFSDEVLHHLRRPHDAAQARTALVNAVGRFDLVDADLILDVEYDDAYAGAFLRDLVRCIELGVQVSTYTLMRFGFTAFGPADHDRRREHEVLAEATRLAGEYGYERRSVWTFNRPGSPSYTSITRRRFLGLGAGASSFLGRDFLVNHFGVETYIAAIMAGHPPVARRLHPGSVGGLAYDAFWQAYSGHLCPPALESGRSVPWRSGRRRPCWARPGWPVRPRRRVAISSPRGGSTATTTSNAG